MTAKITVMQRGESEGFLAEFYTEEEWEQVQRNFEKSFKLGRAFGEEVTEAVRQGFPIQKFIGKERRYEHHDGYDMLTRYVGIVEQGGVAAPYTKSVTVFHLNENYKDVAVVDTPGINDPNQIRSRVTTDWIKEANAVVYVTYAGTAGLSDSDVDFVDRLFEKPDGRVCATPLEGWDSGKYVSVRLPAPLLVTPNWVINDLTGVIGVSVERGYFGKKPYRGGGAS
jgi:hypothetical protein